MKNSKILFLLALFLILPKLIKSGMKIFTFSKFKQSSRDKLLMLQTALINQGLNEKQLKFALAQLLLETGDFSSKSSVSKLNNNYSGIKYICKSYQDAEKGSPVPANERAATEKCSNYYAKFRDADAWAKDFIRILSLQRAANQIGKPINADTLNEYNDRLYANGYYSQGPGKKEGYYKNLLFFFNKID